MNLARILLIVAALAVAGTTAFLVRNFLKESVENGNGKAQEIVKAPTIKVLVALNNLPAGTIVNPDLFLWQNWPKEGLAENYIVQGEDDKKNAVKPADLTGWAVRRGITKGQPITKNRLLEPGKAGFLAGVLSPGMRAVSISVSAESGAAGFILPGDRVDVILTQQVRQTQGVNANRDKIISETVISNVRALAVDQTFDDISEHTRVGKTITLELTPKQTESLAVAKRMGRVSLSLRSLVRDKEVEKKSDFTSDEEVSRFLRGQASSVPRVLMAKHKLPGGRLLRDTDFIWRPLATGQDGADNIFEALTSLTSLRGSYLKTSLEMGTAILHDNIIRPGEQGFIVAALAPGMRAVSMVVSQVSGVSGFVAPGDRVDVLLTHQYTDATDKPVLPIRKFTETLLLDLRLLAIEQIIDPKTGKPQVGETVTLEVTPTQAEVVSLAASMGSLSLSLRSVPAGEDTRQASASSDIGVSQALLDQIILGTRRDPNLLRRAKQLGRPLSSADKAKATATAKARPAAPSPPVQIIEIDDGDETRTITIYRALTPSTVVVKK
ncbi:MAG: Flp pilus assembly protein CpaB [Alphaproteobacteria bacterium]